MKIGAGEFRDGRDTFRHRRPAQVGVRRHHGDYLSGRFETFFFGFLLLAFRSIPDNLFKKKGVQSTMKQSEYLASKCLATFCEAFQDLPRSIKVNLNLNYGCTEALKTF